MIKFIVVTQMLIQGLGVVPMVTTDKSGVPTLFDSMASCQAAARQAELQVDSVIDATCVYYVQP